MTELDAIPGFPSPRLLRRAAVGMLALLFALLALGSVVTSFHVGMADPIWPTRPWHLLTTSWEEPSSGYLIEHSHRAAGFIIGIAATLFALLIWMTESRPVLRWGGLVAIALFVAAFIGHLHGVLIAHQKSFQASGDLTPPDWTAVLWPTFAAFGLTLIIALSSAATGPGGGLRLLGIALLTGIMVQGILGGLRVYLNALCGTDLAAIHGVFSQIVLALAVTVVAMTGPRHGSQSNLDLLRWSIIAAVAVFGQIVAGAILRHTDSPLGPRLHMLGAFLVVFAIAALSRRSRGTSVRGLTVLAASLAGIQILLGIEAWMIRFKAGFDLSAIQQVTQGDAAVRTLHALVGFSLFATVVGTLAILLRDREPARRASAVRRAAVPVEVVV